LGTRLVLAGAVGAVCVSFAMTAAVLVGLPWRVTLVVLAGAGVAAALRLGLGRAAAFPSAGTVETRDARHVAAARTVAGVAVLAALAATAAGAATSPDLLFFWGPKAQQFGLARTVDAAFLRDELHQHMHPYYPPLVTNLGAFATMAAGRMSWTAAALTFPLLLAALALGLPGALTPRIGPTRAAALSALAVAAVALLGVEADIGGNGEMPLLVFETLAIALLLSDAAGEAPTQLLAGILFAGAAATKVEGLPFVAASIVLFFVLRSERVRPLGPALARLVLPPAVMLAAWFAYGASRGLFYGYSGYGRFLDLYPDHLPIVLSAVARSLGVTAWGLPWLIPLAVLAVAFPLARRSSLPIGIAVILTAFFLFTYLHREENPSLWISWSAARIFSPVAVLTVLAASCARPGTASRGTRTEAAYRA
jgi:hypothetical protein